MTKTLTLTQPWATLVAKGQKLVETRTWLTRYRGPILIHAAQGISREWFRYAVELRQLGYLTQAELDGIHHGSLRGAIVARAVLDDVWPAMRALEVIDDVERTFGFYTEERFAWWLRDIEPIDPPLPWRGRLGLWNGPEIGPSGLPLQEHTIYCRDPTCPGSCRVRS